MEGMYSMGILLVDVLFLVFLLLLGIPLPFCFGGALGLMVIFADINMKSLMVWGFDQMISLILVAGPIFILAGACLSSSKIADKLLDLTEYFTTKLKGGIGVIAIITCGFLGAISGSAFTGLAAVGPVLHPKMVSQGYPKGYAASLISASTILGVLIPPSVAMITFGWVTGVSVLACFLSTVFPGILLMAFLSIINLVDAKKFKAPEPAGDTAALLTAEAKTTGLAGTAVAKNQKTGAMHRFISALPALSMPVIILGGIYGGVFTPTEAASVAVLVCILIGVLSYRTMNAKTLFSALKSSSSSIGAIMMMIFFCLLLSQTYVMLQLPQQLVELFTSFTSSKLVVLLFINVFLLFVGMIVNDTTAIVLCAPLLIPLCAAYGVSGVQLAAIMVVNLGFGGLTPPYASILYLGMRVCDCKFEEMLPSTMKFVVLAYFPVSLLTTYIPALSTWLPKVMGLS